MTAVYDQTAQCASLLALSYMLAREINDGVTMPKVNLDGYAPMPVKRAVRLLCGSEAVFGRQLLADYVRWLRSQISGYTPKTNVRNTMEGN